MTLYDRYIYWRLGPAARLVYRAFDNPDAWEFDSHTTKHKPSQLTFWIGNGAGHFKLYKPQEIDCFTGFECRVLYKKHEHFKKMFLFTRMAGMD